MIKFIDSLIENMIGLNSEVLYFCLQKYAYIIIHRCLRRY